MGFTRHQIKQLPQARALSSRRERSKRTITAVEAWRRLTPFDRLGANGEACFVAGSIAPCLGHSIDRRLNGDIRNIRPVLRVRSPASPTVALLWRADIESWGSADSPLLVEPLLEPNDQTGEFIANRSPYDLGIDIEVPMNEVVTHPYHGSPRYLGEHNAGRFGYLACRFSDDLQCPHNGEKQHTIGSKIVASATTGKLYCCLGCFKHVTEPDFVLTQHTGSLRHSLPRHGSVD